MSLTVPDRVHIIPVGYEEDRVCEAAKQLKANHVLLIGHKTDFESAQEPTRGSKYFDNAKSELEEAGIEFEEIACDFFDLYDSLGTIAEASTAFEEEEVYINVSTGSKITAIAGMIASMVTGSTAYYVKAEGYEEIPQGIEDVFELPRYPIQEPDRQQINVLNFIKKREEEGEPATKGHIINFSENQKLPYITRDVGGKAKYRLLDTHIIEPLKKKDYITTQQEGRSKVIEITDKGENLLRAFNYLVDTEPETSEQEDNE